MPHALLLSPDDQAVNAITGVLEEMSVSCERPLDGVSAAQKLNSHSFDLVLVDCENLPAAKLIFDVCRRGNSGKNPVPVAIVDGRAGLPTAFRLGAEQILTKPVAKDQARNTIRTAVSRLHKEEPARTTQTSETAPIAATTAEPGFAESCSFEPGTAEPGAPEPSTGEPGPERAQAAPAPASSQAVQIVNDIPVASADIAPAPTLPAAVEEMALTPRAHVSDVASTEKVFPAENDFGIPQLMPPDKLPDDPVLADIDRGAAECVPSTMLPSHESAPRKPHNFMVAVVVIALVVGAIYSGWRYQPVFRALVQPYLHQVVAVVRPASQHPVSPAPVASARDPKTSLKRAPVPTAQVPAAQIPAATGAQNAQGTNTPVNSKSAEAPVRLSSIALTATSSASIPSATKPESTSDSKATETATASASPMPGAEGSVVLSSKGAEKRLIRYVPPAFPNGTTATGSETTVVLKTMVDGTGKVESVHLAGGNPALADAAIRAVEQWRYRPYVRDGKSMPFQTLVLMDFQRP